MKDLTEAIRNDALPTHFLVETTNRCNLDCPFCMVGQQNELLAAHGSSAHSLMKRPQGLMQKETFDVLLENFLRYGAEWIYLHFQGEPLVNKNTPYFAKRLKDAEIQVGIFTNGLAFSDRSRAELADAEIDLLRFSVDGASEETYQQNRRGGKFADVLDSMKKTVKAHQGKSTRLEWQFIAMRNNEHEIEAARTLAKEIGIAFIVKGFRESVPDLVPLDPSLRSKKNQKPCSDVYYQLGIYWNGDVVPCCYDTDGKEILGNLHEQDLLSIWQSPKYKKLRRCIDNVIDRPEDEPELCRNCLRWEHPASA